MNQEKMTEAEKRRQMTDERRRLMFAARSEQRSASARIFGRYRDVWSYAQGRTV